LHFNRESIVRLHGIDAPETAQLCRDAAGIDRRCGKAATKALERFVAGREIRCSGTERDKYRRLLAVCRVGGREINRWMVANGWARAYLHYSRDYAAEERDAMRARRGLWAGSFNAPWEFRHAGRRVAAAAPPDPGCPIKGNISVNGRIYHTPASRWYDVTAIDPAQGERWFCSEREALEAGWRAPRG